MSATGGQVALYCRLSAKKNCMSVPSKTGYAKKALMKCAQKAGKCEIRNLFVCVCVQLFIYFAKNVQHKPSVKWSNYNCAAVNAHTQAPNTFLQMKHVAKMHWCACDMPPLARASANFQRAPHNCMCLCVCVCACGWASASLTYYASADTYNGKKINRARQ